MRNKLIAGVPLSESEKTKVLEGYIEKLQKNSECKHSKSAIDSFKGELNKLKKTSN